MTSDVSGQTQGAFGEVGPGSRIAGYLIEEQIGSGGMAVVFRARDEVLGRLAAVKIIAPSMADDAEFRARFLRESRTVAAVDSLHIIPVYGAGEADGLLYIATRFVPGGDLAVLMRRAGGPLDPARAVTLVEQVASALDAAHAAGLVHRDVKPQNILVDTVPERPEHVFLSDFGLSKETSSSTGLTVAGQFLGTPDYSAPEQIRGGEVDGRADQYALACVAFVLLTGALPFHRGETVATMYAHLQDQVPSLTRLRPELPSALDGVVARALAKSPADRYARCSDFATALRQALVPARPSHAPWTAPAWAAPDRPAPDQPALPRQSPARAADPWAWAARQDGAGRRPAGQPVWQPPAAFPKSPSAPSTPQLTGRPQQPVFQHPSLPSAYVADWEAAIRENAAYANTVNAGRGNTGRIHAASSGGGDDGPRGKKFRMALIGGSAAVVIAAAGIVYFATQHGGPTSAHSVSSSGASLTAKRPSKPTLLETITVPGDATIDTTWTSPDGKFLAASGQGSTIYVWNLQTRALVRTLTAPNIQVGTTVYSVTIDNVAFSADDSAIRVLTYANVPPGAPIPANASAYAVYQWSLVNDGNSTTIWSVETPSIIEISNDDNTALTYQGSTISQLTLTPVLNTSPPLTLPGGVDQQINPPFQFDLHGDRMIYHPAANETYVWDFASTSVIAKLASSEYTVLSTDGKTILATNPTNLDTGSTAAPMLWDVATQSNITPTDPRWNEQLRQVWQVYSWDTYSTDGSVLMTERAGGNFDLWDTATHKYMTTVTDPTYKEDGFPALASGGSEVIIPHTEKTVNGEREYRQIEVWETQFSPVAGS